MHIASIIWLQLTGHSFFKMVLLKRLAAFCVISLINVSANAADNKNQKNPNTDLRIVALTSLAADLVTTLNPGVIVGVPGTALTKQDARYQGIKRVSSGRSQPNIEAIVSLRPDLVIGATGFHSKTMSNLKRLGIKTLTFKIDRWSRLTEAADSLSKLIPNNGSLQKRLSKICPASPAKASSKKLSVLIIAGINPKLSPARQSWSGSLLDRLSLKNATIGLSGDSQFSGYITMSNERLLSLKPDRVLTVDPAGGLKSEYLLMQKYFSGLNQDDFISMDYYGLINPGSLKSINNACDRLRKL